MVVQRVPATSSSILDVLERVLDRGIVIDAWVGVSLAGIRLLELDTRIVVASLTTYLSRGQDLARVAAAAQPALGRERSSRPSAPVPSPAAPPRRRPRRRKVETTQTAETPPTPRLRCETGCTFEWTKAACPPASIACPYRRRLRCRLLAA